jgi:hypothetical protein
VEHGIHILNSFPRGALIALKLQERIHISLAEPLNFEQLIQLARPFFLIQLQDANKRRPAPTQTQSTSGALQKPMQPTPDLQKPLNPMRLSQSAGRGTQSVDAFQSVVIRSPPGSAQTSIPKLSATTESGLDTSLSGARTTEVEQESLKRKLLRGYTTMENRDMASSPPLSKPPWDRSSDTVRPELFNPTVATSITGTGVAPTPPVCRTTRPSDIGRPLSPDATSTSSRIDPLPDVAPLQPTKVISLIDLSIDNTEPLDSSNTRPTDLLGVVIGKDDDRSGSDLDVRFPPLTQASIARQQEMEVDEFDEPMDGVR